MYNYTVLQQVKASLYYYNEGQIARDIQNYIFALNFEIGSTETCTFTGEKIEITETFLESIENRLLNSEVEMEKRLAFRFLADFRSDPGADAELEVGSREPQATLIGLDQDI